MTRAVETLLAEALRLDVTARAELAAELLESLEELSDAAVDSAWAAEIQRRIEAVEAGAMELRPWSEVRKRLERKLGAR